MSKEIQNLQQEIEDKKREIFLLESKIDEIKKNCSCKNEEHKRRAKERVAKRIGKPIRDRNSYYYEYQCPSCERKYFDY